MSSQQPSALLAVPEPASALPASSAPTSPDEAPGVRPARSTATAPAEADSVPNWVQEIREKYSVRLRDYLDETWAFTVRPRATGRQWATREREFLNPLRFLALGFAIAVGVRHAGEIHVLGQPNLDASLGALLTKPWMSQLLIVALAVFAHPWFWWMGSRVALRGSIGASIFAFAGPAVLLEVLTWSVSATWHTAGTVPLVSLVPEVGAAREVPLHYSHYPTPVILASYASFLWFAATLAGVHGLRWWRATIAFVAGVASTAIAFAVCVVLVALAGRALG